MNTLIIFRIHETEKNKTQIKLPIMRWKTIFLAIYQQNRVGRRRVSRMNTTCQTIAN